MVRRVISRPIVCLCSRVFCSHFALFGCPRVQASERACLRVYVRAGVRLAVSADLDIDMVVVVCVTNKARSLSDKVVISAS